MHPYLKSRREAYEEIRSAITTVQDTAVREERDLTEPELTQIRSLSEQAKTIADEIEALAEHESRTEAVRSVAAAVHGGSTAADDPFAPFSLLPSSEHLTELRSSIERGERHYRVQTGRVGEHTRAVVQFASVDGPETGGPVAPLNGGLPEPRRIVTAVGLPAQGTDSGGATGPLFGATSGTAPTDEGGTKPEADSITPLTIVPQALARWTDVSRHALLSQPGFAEQLMSWHAQSIAKDEDLLIATALDSAAGTPIGTGDGNKDVRTAVAMVTDAVSADADIVLVNPADYAEVSAFSPSSAGDVASYAARIGEALIYPTSAVSAGTVLVAALRAGGRFVVAERPTVVAQEALKTNVTTVRTEELVGFGVRLAGSVVAVDLEASV